MDFLPIFMNMRGAAALVVGGGDVAVRKARLLREAGCQLTVVAPDGHPELAEWVAAGSVLHHVRPFAPSDIAGQRLVIAATDDPAVNAQVSAVCMAANIPVNVVDNPRLCSFI